MKGLSKSTCALRKSKSLHCNFKWIRLQVCRVSGETSTLAQPALSCFVYELQNQESQTDTRCLFSPVCCVSEAGLLVKTYVERSMLVPDHVMTRLMLPRLEQLSGHSWLLDGKKNWVVVFCYNECFFLFFALLFFSFLLTLTYSTLLHYSVFIVCSEVGRDVFMMQPHGSIRNCQLSFKSDWPPLGATPQILTLKVREKKRKKESKDTLVHFQKFTTKSHMLWLYLNLRGLKNTLLTILNV